MVNFFGIFEPGKGRTIGDAEAPNKTAFFDMPFEAADDFDDAAPTQAELDEAYLTSKCPEPLLAQPREKREFRFVSVAFPPYL